MQQSPVCTYRVALIAAFMSDPLGLAACMAHSLGSRLVIVLPSVPANVAQSDLSAGLL